MCTVFKSVILVSPIMLWLISTAFAGNSYSKNSDRIIVTIDADVLKSILTTQQPFTFVHENDAASFLDEFKIFLVSYSWNEPEKNEVMKVAAEYNKNHFRTYSKDSIKLMVSFQPRDDIRADINIVTDAITEINSIYLGTAAAVVLDYNLLQLEVESLLLVNHEIRLVREKINSLADKNLLFALQLDLNNCKHRVAFIKKLALIYVNIVLLSEGRKETVTKNQNEISFALAEQANCVQLSLDNALPAPITTFISIRINTENRSYAYDRHLSTAFISEADTRETNTKKTILIFWTEVNNQSKIGGSSSFDGMSKMSPEWVSWLQKPVTFSKKHFGGVISAKDGISQRILDKFQEVIIEIGDHTLNTRKAIEHILTGLLGHSNSTQRTYENEFGQRNGEKVHIVLLVTITKNDFDYNVKLVDNAIWAILHANEMSPGTAIGILFDWMACGMSEECSGYNNTNPSVYCSIFKMEIVMKKLFDYAGAAAEKILTRHAAQLGTCMDVEITSKILRTAIDQGCDQTGANFGKHLTTLKFVVHEENLTRNGATKMFNIITAQFTIFGNIIKKDKGTVVYYYVQIVGCNGNYSCVSQLTDYALLYEKLNTWAVSRNGTLYVDATIENPETCGQRTYTSSPEKYCECGFWVSTNNRLDYQKSEIHILNKKELALKLYEKSWKSRSSNNETAPPPTPVNIQMLYWILVPLLLVAMLITVVAITLRLHYRSKYIMTREEVANFLRGRIQGNNSINDLNKDENNSAESKPYNSEKYELKPSSFKIDTSFFVGSGEFGKVFKGTIHRTDGTTDSAVKVANTRALSKSHGGRLALFGLLAEIKILSYLGEHENIVCLLGAFTAKLREGKISVFLEFCELGSLYKYLRSIQPDRQEAVSDSDPNAIALLEIVMEGYMETEQHSLSTTLCDELYGCGGQIARGMQFLVSKNVVHADLATRNVLLTQEKVVKICDFGLSRRMYDYTEYVKSSQAPLPWRWMAPESLRRLIFTEKSDVWAFGVLLWEIFTLGDEPYPGLSWQENFPAMLARGLQLPAPKYNVKQIYSVMKQCWNVNPDDRPTFAELSVELNQVMEG